jgi:hypothetical protein
MSLRRKLIVPPPDLSIMHTKVDINKSMYELDQSLIDEYELKAYDDYYNYVTHYHLYGRLIDPKSQPSKWFLAADDNFSFEFTGDVNGDTHELIIKGILNKELLDLWMRLFSYILKFNRPDVRKFETSDLEFMSDILNLIEKSKGIVDNSFISTILLHRLTKVISSLTARCKEDRDDHLFQPPPEDMLSFITGSLLKLRVALASNLLLDVFGKAQDTDIEFNHYFKDLSKRTPDYIFADHEKRACIVIETSFSSRRSKGLIAKGVSFKTSKYYEEMFHILSKGYSLDYLPIIFFDKMPLRPEEFNTSIQFDALIDEFSNQFADLSIINLKKNYKKKRDHKISKDLVDGLPYTLYKRQINKLIQMAQSIDTYKFVKYYISLSIMYSMNDNIYPRGKMLNKSITYLPSYSIKTRGFTKYNYIIEYNYYLLIAIIPEMTIFPKDVLDYTLSKRNFSSITDDFRMVDLKHKFLSASRVRSKNEYVKNFTIYFINLNDIILP